MLKHYMFIYFWVQKLLDVVNDFTTEQKQLKKSCEISEI